MLHKTLNNNGDEEGQGCDIDNDNLTFNIVRSYLVFDIYTGNDYFLNKLFDSKSVYGKPLASRQQGSAI